MNTQTTPPAARVLRKNRASVCSAISTSALRLDRFVGDLGGIERRGETLLFAVIARAVPEPRSADPGRAVAAEELAVGVLAEHFVDEQVLGDDDVAFHSH